MSRVVPPPPHLPDQGVAWHYGDPFREQRDLADGVGIVDFGNRGVVAVTGPDRLAWLHSLTTQHLTGLEPGASALALILSPHGHVEFELHLVDDGEVSWIVTQPGQADGLVAYLDAMRFMLRVDVADRSGDHGVVWEPVGGRDEAAPTWLMPSDFAARGLPGREVILPTAVARDRLEAASAPAGSWALEALRTAALVPRIGCETDHRTIPNELGWLTTAVHLDKGCYRGQETVAKVHNLGQPPRRLTLLHLDGSSDHPPRHGDAVLLGEKQVGWIGTGAQHFELGPIATAVLKRGVPADAPLLVRTAEGDQAAAQDGPPAA